MAIQSVLSFVNNVGYTISNTFTTFLTLNYILGESVMRLALTLLSSIGSAFHTLALALHIMLEDLAVFLHEAFDTFVSIFEFLFSCIDSTFALVHLFLDSIKCGFLAFLANLKLGLGLASHAITSVSCNFGHLLNLLASSLVLLASLVPRTLHAICFTILGTAVQILDSLGATVRTAYNAAMAAKAEALCGFVAATVLLYAGILLAKRFIRNRQITSRHVAVMALKVICLVYMGALKGLICFVRGSARTVEFTLTHLHVPRFHHAGDSDEEDVATNDDGELILDESDAGEETERVEQRRRNYDLLVQRRNERCWRSKSSKPNKIYRKDEEDVEEMLFEQVEREREDKLCVICQDNEKCVMILPCRHLCICQTCQQHLLHRNNNYNNTCPICRKNVRQTIKAYL